MVHTLCPLSQCRPGNAPSPSPTAQAQATTLSQDRAPLGMGLLEESDAADDEGAREVASLLEKTLGALGKKKPCEVPCKAP